MFEGAIEEDDEFMKDFVVIDKFEELKEKFKDEKGGIKTRSMRN